MKMRFIRRQAAIVLVVIGCPASVPALPTKTLERAGRETVTDVTDFSGVTGQELTADQIRGIVKQLDLDMYNLVRDGKNAGATYRIGDRMVSKVEWMRQLRETRQYYAELLARLPAIQTTVYDDPDV